jgi:hypothetical protein
MVTKKKTDQAAAAKTKETALIAEAKKIDDAHTAKRTAQAAIIKASGRKDAALA